MIQFKRRLVDRQVSPCSRCFFMLPVHCFYFSWTLPSRSSKPLTQIKKEANEVRKSFRIFLDCFRIFLDCFRVLAKVINFHFVGWFLLFFFNSFPQKFGPCPVFKKSKKFQFVGWFAVSANFWSVSGLQKKLEDSN